MAIKQFGDEYSGLDEFAKAIPAAIQGFYDSEDRNMKKKELAARLMAENSKRERQTAMDRLKVEQEYGLEVPQGQEFDYGMLNKGLLSKREGFVSMTDLKRQALEQDIKYKGGTPQREILEQVATMRTKGFEPVFNEDGTIKDFVKSQALLDKEAAELAKIGAQTKATEAKARPKAGKAADSNRYNVPGAIYEGGTTLKPDEVKKVRSIVSNVNPIVTNIRKAQQKLQNATAKDYLDPTFRREVSGLLNDAKLTYKSDAFAQLGVLTGPDLEILDAVISDPFSMKGMASGPQAVAKSYDRAIEQIKTRIESGLSPYGYRPDPSLFEVKGTTEQAPASAPSGGGAPWEKFKK